MLQKPLLVDDFMQDYSPEIAGSMSHWIVFSDHDKLVKVKNRYISEVASGRLIDGRLVLPLSYEGILSRQKASAVSGNVFSGPEYTVITDGKEYVEILDPSEDRTPIVDIPVTTSPENSFLANASMSAVWNVVNPPVKELAHIKTKIEPNTKRGGSGQQKLLAVDVPLLTIEADVYLLIGGAPGDHFATPWLESRWEKLVFIDPRDRSHDKGVHFKELFQPLHWDQYTKGAGSVVVINDIRPDKKDGQSVAEWESVIAENWDLGMEIEHMCHEDKRVLAYSFKFRPSRNRSHTTYPADSLNIVQPWVWERSPESRLFIRYPRGDRMKTIENKAYFQALDRWNDYRVLHPEVSREQEEYLSLLYQPRMNALSFKGEENDIGVGLWSLSNTMNPKPVGVVKKLIENFEKFIVLFPNARVLRRWPPGFMSVSDGPTLVQEQRGRIFTDHKAIPEMFYGLDVVSMPLSDLICWAQHTITGDYFGNANRYFVDRNSPMSNLWFAVMSRKLFPFPSYQTWLNSQTHYARMVSVPMRRIFALEDDAVHIMRRAALISLYPDAILVHDSRVNGIVKGTPVAVSGHLMNLLLWSSVYFVDFRRYLDTIEFNVEMFSSSKVPSSYKILVGKDLMAEDNSQSNVKRLWHSYQDFVTGVAAYIMMSKAIRAPLNVRALVYILRRLNAIKRKYPRFLQPGWQAAQFLRQKTAVRERTVRV